MHVVSFGKVREYSSPGDSGDFTEHTSPTNQPVDDIRNLVWFQEKL
jgi:hypothetical protein